MQYVLRKLNFGKNDNFEYKNYIFSFFLVVKIFFIILVVPSIQDLWFVDL